MLSKIERQLRRVLIETAAAGETITYSQLGESLMASSPVRLEPPWSPMYRWLGAVLRYEFESDRPVLTAIVVRAHEGDPGPGFLRELIRLGVVDGGAVPADYYRALQEECWDYWRNGVDTDPEVAEPTTSDQRLSDGRRLRVAEFPNGTVRIDLEGSYGLTSASLGNDGKGRAVLTLVPIVR